MARGRMIANEIARDKKINSLSDPWSMLGFTWLVTFADSEGRTYGDPALVRSMIFPRQPEITTEQVEGYIREWARLGLIEWYEADDDWWISFPNFDKHQPGLRKDREPNSAIPAPPTKPDDNPIPDDCRINDGKHPDENGLKLREVEVEEEIKDKENQDNGADAPPPQVPAQTTTAGIKYFKKSFGMTKNLTPVGYETILALEKKYGTVTLQEVIDWAAKKQMHAGDAITAIETAIKDWGNVKIPKNGHRGKPPDHSDRDRYKDWEVVDD